MDREKVIKAFDDAKELVWMEDDEYTVGYNAGIEAGKNITLALLKEQNNWLGIQQTADGITFISSGTAAQGEKRGIMLGKALVYERLEKELLYRGLLSDDIRSAFAKVWGELE